VKKKPTFVAESFPITRFMHGTAIALQVVSFKGGLMQEVLEEKSIVDYFEKDHNRLDDLFEDFNRWKSKDYLKAKEFFVAFKFGLQRHIVWEEEILFPIFEEATGMIDEGPTYVMRREHRMIGEKLEAIHKKVQIKDPNSDAEEKELLSILTLHNEKEERILYPAIQHIVEQKENIQEIFKKMRDIPEERYKTCCGTHGAV
jgi:iron-sulfur cluster repair protein YtfE (RIC family)